MGSTEKFCLRWNDFETNVSVAFRELREDKDFFDVTLACDDSQVEAHKVILSACSPFFRQVLRRNPHQHPLLYLKGVKFKELLAVLNFMYQGEVNVAQEELNAFLTVAEDLRVKGLTQNTGSSSSSENHKSELSSSNNTGSSSKSAIRSREPPDRTGDHGPPGHKRPRTAANPSSSGGASSVSSGANSRVNNFSAKEHSRSNDDDCSQDDDDIQEVMPVKMEPRDISQMASSTAVASVAPAADYAVRGGGGEEEDGSGGGGGGGQLALDNEYADDSYDYGDYGDGGGVYGGGDDSGLMDPNTGLPIPTGTDGNKDLGELIKSKILSLDTGVWGCKDCGYQTSYKTTLSRHIEAKHLVTSGLLCPICRRFCPTSNALQSHQYRYHREAAHPS